MAAALHKVLIAAHTFPPSPGIGGRRWAKHAKYLQRAGIEVVVLTAKTEETGSPWSADAAGIARHTYHHRFPKVLSSTPKGAGGKLAYRAALAMNKLRSEGTPYDRALYDKSSFLAVLKSLLEKERPDALVVTAAPFRLPWYALELRKAFPEVVFVADFRDPWTSGESYGYRKLRGRRKSFEETAESDVIEGFDLVTTPWPGLVEGLRQKYPARASHIGLLPHCYDPDEVPEGNDSPSQNPTPKVAYGGNLYQGFEPLYAGLSGLANEGLMEADFWSADADRILAPLSHEGFRIHPPVSSTAFLAEAAKADWLLMPIPEVLRDGRPTKLFEYAALGVPILAVGAAGSLSETIASRGLGHFVESEGGMEPLRSIVTSGPKNVPDMDWVGRHTAPAVVEQLLEMIETLKHD